MHEQASSACRKTVGAEKRQQYHLSQFALLQFLEQHRRELWGCAWFVLGYVADGLCVVLAKKLNVRAVSSHSFASGKHGI
jgi:hypothetical protein